MDILAQQPNAANALLAITKSTNAHILGLYWNGAEVEGLWVLRSKTTQEIRGTEALNALHAAFMDIQVREAADGRLEVKFGGIPVMDNRKLYLTGLPGAPSGPHYGIIFEASPGRFAQLREIFVDLETPEASKCYCRCVTLPDSQEFVEAVDVDLGPIAQFM